jgi:hypothetical protein
MSRSVRFLGALALVTVCTLASCGHSSGNSIHWADFVQFDGIFYLRQLVTNGQAVNATDLGAPYATVNFELNGHETNPSYLRHDGDAAYLPAGTPVYSVTGYPPTFLLAGQEPSVGLALFVVQANPQANVGADFLAIGGKVKAINVLSPQDATTVVGSITQTVMVAHAVALILDAPVNQTLTPEGSNRYFIAFQLMDGLAVTQVYFPQSHYLGPGIIVPTAFGQMIQQAVSGAHQA